MADRTVPQMKILGLKFSQADALLLKILAPLIWVFMAYATYLAFASGLTGQGIAHGGLLLVLFCGMIHLWGLVDSARDIALSKVMGIATLFGALVCATGWLIRLTT